MDAKAPSRTKARLVVLTVFVIGIAAGALSMNLYQRAGGPDPSGPHPGRRSPLRDMTEKLNLTADQQQQVQAILDDTFKKYREIRDLMEPCVKEFEPRFDSARQEGRDKIRAVLTQDQVPKYEEMVREQDRRRERWKEQRDKK